MSMNNTNRFSFETNELEDNLQLDFDSMRQQEAVRREVACVAEKEAKRRAMVHNILSWTITFIVAVAISFLLFIVVIPYVHAHLLSTTGNYEKAVNIFENYAYKDCQKEIEKCYERKYGKEQWAVIRNLKVGDTFTFGTYEQDNNLTNGPEPIEWSVLLKYNQYEMLLVAKDALDCQQFHPDCSADWVTSSLRQWMNRDFFNAAFTDDEQTLISPTPTAQNAGTHKLFYDQVFLLSEGEFVEVPTEQRQFRPTAYACARGAELSTGSFLRTTKKALFLSGDNESSRVEHCVVCADTNGTLIKSPVPCNAFYCIRPAITLSFEI